VIFVGFAHKPLVAQEVRRLHKRSVRQRKGPADHSDRLALVLDARFVDYSNGPNNSFADYIIIPKENLFNN